MASVELLLPDGMWPAILAHLQPKHARFEEAAFAFATVEQGGVNLSLRAAEWYPVPPEDFEEQSPYFLQLADETKAKVIKRAHDLQAALVEFHSHPFQSVAEFSPSDLIGFSEFVPHVRWRLKRRPYAAIVVGGRTFDALTWCGDEGKAGPLRAIVAEGASHFPTSATFSRSRGRHE